MKEKVTFWLSVANMACCAGNLIAYSFDSQPASLAVALWRGLTAIWCAVC